MRVINRRKILAYQWQGPFGFELKDGGDVQPGDWIVFTEDNPDSDDGYAQSYTPEKFKEKFEVMVS